MFSTFFILFIKISLYAEAHLEPSETSTGLIIWSLPFRAEFLRLFSVTVSEAAVRRCSIKKFAKFCKTHKKTPVRESFLMQSFRVIEIEKVIAKHKFVNRYSATKRAHLYCKWLCCKWACFKFSFASSHLNYSSEMQSVFLTWIQAHNLSFSIQAGFNYRLHDYFQLVYMAWKFQIAFLQTMVKF